MAVIVITAHVHDHQFEEAQREGLLAALPKPVPVGYLLNLLKAARRDGLVVVVEDNASLRENLREALRGRGFAAVLASNIAEIEQLAPVRPFCALVDLCVPGGPAGQAVRVLAKKFPDLPMLVVTAYPEASPLPPACTGLFLKPFDTASLLDAVERQYWMRWSARSSA